MGKMKQLLMELEENGYNEEDEFNELYKGADGDYRFTGGYSKYDKGDVLEEIEEEYKFNHPEEHY